MVSEKDRRHADLMAGFFSNLGVAYVAGAVLVVERAYGGRDDI